MKTTVSVYVISRSYDYKREGKTRRTYTFRIWEGSKIEEETPVNNDLSEFADWDQPAEVTEL